jgi:hypothetical protein
LERGQDQRRLGEVGGVLAVVEHDALRQQAKQQLPEKWRREISVYLASKIDQKQTSMYDRFTCDEGSNTSLEKKL